LVALLLIASSAGVSAQNTQYFNTWRDGWFMQAGAGVSMPVMEGFRHNKKRIGAVYNLGVGRWFSPYFGFRFSGYYGATHERLSSHYSMHWRDAALNVDLMWDLCNSLGGVDLKRPVSVVPFIGLGGNYNYRFRNVDEINVLDSDGHRRTNSWTLPVSAGVQLRVRLCRYADFFVETRAVFAGDNFNNIVGRWPIDINLQSTAGLTINFGGRSFETYSPGAYAEALNSMNEQVNALRAELVGTAAALAVAESQLPCPPSQPAPRPMPQSQAAPLLTTVRFTLNSARVSSTEMVNVYNMAQYLQQNPTVNVIITGYADRDTGTEAYNMTLSEQRAMNVADILVNTYGIDSSRLTVTADGSNSQPYETNSWNRIVTFTQQ
jgi:outer membrane protein OmpA-like peptidoglycan-associated protein